jgi:hypothetical protein
MRRSLEAERDPTDCGSELDEARTALGAERGGSRGAAGIRSPRRASEQERGARVEAVRARAGQTTLQDALETSAALVVGV